MSPFFYCFVGFMVSMLTIGQCLGENLLAYRKAQFHHLYQREFISTILMIAGITFLFWPAIMVLMAVALFKQKKKLPETPEQLQDTRLTHHLGWPQLTLCESRVLLLLQQQQDQERYWNKNQVKKEYSKHHSHDSAPFVDEALEELSKWRLLECKQEEDSEPPLYWYRLSQQGQKHSLYSAEPKPVKKWSRALMPQS